MIVCLCLSVYSGPNVANCVVVTWTVRGRVMLPLAFVSWLPLTLLVTSHSVVANADAFACDFVVNPFNL